MHKNHKAIDSKNKLSESKELINALDKINNIAGM